MATFVPRLSFPALDSLPRSYFLGHHHAGLQKMKTILSSVDLIIECRDYRIPLTSRNPLFEESLAGNQRLIIYTKCDVGSQGSAKDRKREEIICKWHRPTSVLFSNHKDQASIRRILHLARDHAVSINSLTGSRMMVVGMPNVGKSSLLNALRLGGVKKGKAAFTGAQPGVTRKIGTSVKIIEGDDTSEGVYLLDTPGVFIPYVPNAESMLKLALCGSVKDTIIAPTTLADYLLYHLNLQNPRWYSEYRSPTNDVTSFLEAVGFKTGRLQKGGSPDLEASALWIIQRWRGGHLGRFVLDEVNEDTLEGLNKGTADMGTSISQARRADRDLRSQLAKKKFKDAG